MREIMAREGIVLETLTLIFFLAVAAVESAVGEAGNEWGREREF